MGKIKAKKIFIVLVIVIASVAVYIAITQDDGYLLIKGPTEVLKEPYPMNYFNKPNEIITVLENGEKVEVSKIRYPKGYMYYMVHLKDGRTGYVLSGNFEFFGNYGRHETVSDK